MNAALLLASDFIERAACLNYGAAVNDEYALRWLTIRAGGNPVAVLNVAELGLDDIDALSPEAWLWIGANLGANDPELPSSLVEALFTATDDPIFRLRIADVSLRHPSLGKRYLESFAALLAAPSSWARDRLVRLASSDLDRDGLIEMTTILLQVGNKPALQLLSGLRRQQRDIVDETLSRITGLREGALSELLIRLGLSDIG